MVDADQVPVADAGGEQVIVLPAPLVTVNGSKSSDDRKIVSYLWTRDRSSPAAGVRSCSMSNVMRNIAYASTVSSHFAVCYFAISRFLGVGLGLGVRIRV